MSDDTSVQLSEFEEQFLKAHNEYRERHGVEKLTFSREISNYAQQWANTLVRIRRLQHRNPNKYGENIFYAWSSDPNHTVTGRDPVASWYSEISKHVFGASNINIMASGHFTQVVWEDTKVVGVGVAKAQGHIYVVANYSPPGNMMGSFGSKVHPLKPK